MTTKLLSVVVFLCSAAIYLTLAGQVSRSELMAGAAAAAATTAFMASQHAGRDRRLQLRAPWGHVLRRSLTSLVTDSARVGAALVRAVIRRPVGSVGVIAKQPFRTGTGRPQDAGRRAITILGSSLAPNGFVIDMAPSLPQDAEGALTMHRLVPDALKPDTDWPL